MSGGGDIPRVSQKIVDSGIAGDDPESFGRTPIHPPNRRSPGLLPLLQIRVTGANFRAWGGSQGLESMILVGDDAPH